ncbi:serine/threonine-protein kinase [Roseiconus lacunae]|uniref:serine/threonine-protein kinase n=1 Tax=Roseiconus lacunae TaxID=2605694 RepID=UPI001E444DC8|nr:serine/threonine-protein kinase [Roseiconus lacunae]MCD0461747.1 serine/threonine protein kinase [Roseiconus lacunae]
MNLHELSADELAVLDSVCLAFENDLRANRSNSIEDSVKQFIEKFGGQPSRDLIELLREELGAIEVEISDSANDRQLGIGPPTPFQAKTDRATTGHERVAKSVGNDIGDRRLSSSSASRLAKGGGSQAVGMHQGETLYQSAEELAHGGGTSVDETQQEPNELRQRFTIGPFSVSAVLAKGGMGVVYRAADTRLDRPVAIKMLGFPHLAPNDPKRLELVERFEREAKAVAALSHPNIVELFDVGVEAGAPYAVMEFLSGLTLAEQLSNGPLSLQQSCDVGKQIASALATAHSSGVIHRDLKPQNVMLVDDATDGQLRVKLVDFGLSRIDDTDLLQDDSKKTAAGMILGTPGYMAPEQARGEPATEAADMFAFGCVLYEAFYGKPAIVGRTVADRLAATLTGEVEFESAGCEQSRLLCEIIKQCLEKDPTLRPSAADVATKLRDFMVKQTREAAQEELRASLNQSLTIDAITRRHAMTAMAGGVLGAMLGVVSNRSAARAMPSVRAIAVLTPREKDPASSSIGDGLPLDGRRIEDADILASSLVSEFSKIDGLEVRPYRPMMVDETHDYVRLGKDLDVQVLVDGVFEQQQLGGRYFWSYNWQVIDAKKGAVLAGSEFVVEQSQESSDGQFLARSQVAAEIAKEIGRNLTTTGQIVDDQPDPHSYGCLVKGRAYADLDSTLGLRNALACFDHAHQEDPRRSDPLAASAVTALHLAARTGMPESAAFIKAATEKFTHALDLDPNSLIGRLARAMYEWQAQYDFGLAGEIFSGLLSEGEYNWQVQHQSGLYFAAMGKQDQARECVGRAARLHPMSLMLKIDRARLEWFFGYHDRAMRSARRFLDESADTYPARPYVVGLLLDQLEEQFQYEAALELLGQSTDMAIDRTTYYEVRESTLETFPYGPFGVELNQAIWRIRSGTTVDESLVARLDESGALMLPLLLAQHPAFEKMKAQSASMGFLPAMT